MRKEVRRRRPERWFAAYKRERCSCERCGEGHPACLDFHHADEKTMDVSRTVNHGYAKCRIRDEMGARITLCANYHRRGTIVRGRLLLYLRRRIPPMKTELTAVKRSNDDADVRFSSNTNDRATGVSGALN